MRLTSISLLILLLITSCKKPESEVTTLGAWEKATTFMSNEAHQDFQRLLREENTDPREVRLGIALTLISKQPRVASNLNNAERILLQLVQENAHDEVGKTARLALGRYHQTQAQTQNLDLAMDYYRQLFEEHPQSLQGQHGFANLAMLTLTPQLTSDELFPGRLAELEAQAQRLTFPSAELMFQLAVGTACAFRKLEPEALIRNFSLAADSEFLDSRRKSDCLVIAGNTALRIGNFAEANRLFSRFVKEFPRDARNFTIQKMLNEINIPLENIPPDLP